MVYQYKYPHPAVTADIILFSIIDNELNVALVERAKDPFQGCWALPGGFIRMDETLEDGALRELEEEAGVTRSNLDGLPFLQVGAYGTPGRDPRERVISVAFMTLVPSDRVDLVASSDASKAQWYPLSRLPPLAFDHQKILDDARTMLSGFVSTDLSAHADTVFSFLPEEFTLVQAQAVFEMINGQQLDKRNFRKWISANWELVDLNKKTSGDSHRPAALYKLAGRKMEADG